MARILKAIKPVPNWRDVFKYAWSVRLMAIAALLTGVEAAFAMMAAFAVKPSFIPTGLFAGLSCLVTVAAFVARFVAQKKLGAVDGNE